MKDLEGVLATLEIELQFALKKRNTSHGRGLAKDLCVAIRVLRASWKQFLNPLDLCGLCGQHGVIDTVGHVITPAGVDAGIRMHCVCPNGLAFKAAGVSVEELLQRKASLRAELHAFCECGHVRDMHCQHNRCAGSGHPYGVPCRCVEFKKAERQEWLSKELAERIDQTMKIVMPGPPPLACCSKEEVKS